MNNSPANRTVMWARVAIIFGLVSLFAYFFSIVFKPFPLVAGRILFFSIGPLSIISVFALYKVLKEHSDSITLQLGTLFHIIAGAVLNMMAVVQATQFTTISRQIKSAGDEAAKDILTKVLCGVNVVQSGLDISWDIFISVGTIFLGIAVIKHPFYGRIIGIIGIVISAAALGFNLYTFPSSPASSGLIDLGPGVGIWYILLILFLIKNLKTLQESVDQKT